MQFNIYLSEIALEFRYRDNCNVFGDLTKSIVFDGSKYQFTGTAKYNLH